MLNRCVGKCRPQYWHSWPSRAKTLRRLRWTLCFGRRSNSEQADDARNLDLEIDGADPIVFGLFDFGTQFAHLAPRIERIGGELAVFEMNHFGQFAAKQGKSAAHVDDVDGHVEPIEHQDAARQSAAGGGEGGGGATDAPASRAMHPGSVRIGFLKALHVQPPMLCQSSHCSRFSGSIPTRATEKFIGGESVAIRRVGSHNRRRICSRHANSATVATVQLSAQDGHVRGKNSRRSACQPPGLRIRMIDVGCGVILSCRHRDRPGPTANRERGNDPVLM